MATKQIDIHVSWLHILHSMLLLFSFRALSAFEDGDFEEVREKLELVPGASLSDLGVNNHNYSLWSCKEKLDLINKQFIRLATACQDPKSTANK